MVLIPRCAANFTAAAFDAVLAVAPDMQTLSVTSERPEVQVGEVARFTVTTNRQGAPLIVTPGGVTAAALTVCSGNATLVGDTLTVGSGGATGTATVTLCAVPATAAPVTLDVAAPTPEQRIVWEWNGRQDCQVYASFASMTGPGAGATQAVTPIPTPTPTPTPTPVEPVTPGSPVLVPSATTPARAQLRVTKTSTRTWLRAGDRVSFVIRVRNTSNRPATRVRVCDRLPVGLIPVRATENMRMVRGQRCWTVGTLGAKRAKRFVIVARALPERPDVASTASPSPPPTRDRSRLAVR